MTLGPGPNAPAYFARSLVTKKKSLIVSTPELDLLLFFKTFFFEVSAAEDEVSSFSSLSLLLLLLLVETL